MNNTIMPISKAIAKQVCNTSSDKFYCLIIWSIIGITAYKSIDEIACTILEIEKIKAGTI